MGEGAAGPFAPHSRAEGPGRAQVDPEAGPATRWGPDAALQLLTAPERRPRGARGAVPAPSPLRKPAALKGRERQRWAPPPGRALPASPPPRAADRCGTCAGAHGADAVPRGLCVGGGERVGPSPSGSPKISRLPNLLPDSRLQQPTAALAAEQGAE